MQCCFFEDDICTGFKPLTLTRPTDDLRTGILTLREKWLNELGVEGWGRLNRAELAPVFSHDSLDDAQWCLWVNSRFLPSEKLINKIEEQSIGTAIVAQGATVAAKLSASQTKEWRQDGVPDFDALQTVEMTGLSSIQNVWDLFLMNSREIKKDIERLNPPTAAEANIAESAVLGHENNIFLGDGVTIQPGAILTAGEGPIYLGENAQVSPGAIVEGPVAICENSMINPGAKIHSNTTVGPVCKVGGEVSDSIFHSYSNKGHDGYVGSSLIGQWCNFGAGTNTSNLKNNYSNIRITDWESQQPVETGQQFLGTVMGDHTKTAIGAQLNTGTVCGVSCNIFASGFPPKFMPSFSWVGDEQTQTYKIDKALETMEAVMARRDVALSDEYRTLMRGLFEGSRS